MATLRSVLELLEKIRDNKIKSENEAAPKKSSKEAKSEKGSKKGEAESTAAAQLAEARNIVAPII